MDTCDRQCSLGARQGAANDDAETGGADPGQCYGHEDDERCDFDRGYFESGRRLAVIRLDIRASG